MSDKLHEQISALMDGELDEGEARLLVRRFERDPELRGVWDRYQRCARLMADCDGGGPGVSLVHSGFSQSIMERIHSESRHPAPVSRWREWLRPVAGVAVAAGVATVALVGLQGGQLGDGAEQVEVVPGVAADASPWSSQARFAPAAAGTRLGTEDDSLRRLNTYRLDHAERTAGLRRLEAEAEQEEGENGQGDEPR